MVRLRQFGGIIDASERGDTLIEVLVTVVIISIAVTALLGGLLTSTSASVTHRHAADLDSIVRSFAETVRHNVETEQPVGQPGQAGASASSFQPCATSSSYQIASDPYPRTGPSGAPAATTAVTVFGIGLATPATVTVGGTSATVLSSTGDITGSTTTFLVPPGLAPGPQPIVVDGIQTSNPFLVNSANPTPLSPLSGYTLTSTFTYWNGSSFTTSCTTGVDANLQQLTIRVAETEPGNAAGDIVSIVLANLNPLAVPTVTMTAVPPVASLGTPFSLTTTVTGVSGVASPTGSIIWSGPTGAPCPPSSAASPATCAVTSSQAAAGTYRAYYSGDTNYTGTTATPTFTVSQGNPVVTVVLDTPPPLVAPASLHFTATFIGVPGFAPQGRIAWNGPCTGTTPLTAAAPYQATCSISGVAGGTYTETASYQPGTDTNYTAGTPGSTTFTVLDPTTTSVSVGPPNPTVGETLTFTATVSGTSPLAGSVSWSVGCASTTPLTTSAPYTATCSVNAPLPGAYSETATYNPDSAHTTSWGSATAVVREPATVNVTGSVSGNGTNAVLTFDVTVSGTAGVPTGTVSWSIATSPAMSGVTCPDSTLTPLGTATCSISGTALNSSTHYTATAYYGGNTVYAPAQGSSGSVKG